MLIFLFLQLSVRSKNTKEKLGSLFKGFSKSIDESLLKGHKDVDQWFETEKKFLDDYHVKCVLIPPPPSPPSPHVLLLQLRFNQTLIGQY